MSNPIQPSQTEKGPTAQAASWLVAFRLAPAARKTDVQRLTFADQRFVTLLTILSEVRGMLSIDESGDAMTISLRAHGQMDDALVETKAALVAALSKAHLGGLRIEGARMADRPAVLSAIDSETPIRLLSVTEVAKTIGVSKQRVSAMVKSGRIPEPDAMVGSAPGWLSGNIEAFASSRTQQKLLVDLPR